MASSFPALEVYCCYDLADAGFYQAFKKQLAPLIHQGWIHLWDEQQILPGQEIVQERERHLYSADLLLLLVSPDFLASETGQHQMSMALAMHQSGQTVMLPILIRPCRWQETVLSTFQILPREQKALNTQPNPDEAWEGIVSEISHTVETRRQWVFVVSASSDRIFVEQLRQDMASNHLALWYQKSEETSSGLSRDTDVRDVMRGSFAVIVIASPEASNSRIVKAQLDLAADYQRPIIIIWAKGEDWETSNPGHWHMDKVLDMRAECYGTAKVVLLNWLQQNRRVLPISPRKHFQQEPRNPYKGLQAFGKKDARDFFGRTELIDEMATVVEKIHVQEKKSHQRSRLLAVIGASGSGKSSVVMAGLLPCLQQGGVFNSQEWIYLDPMMPGTHPLEALAVSLSQQPSLRDISSLSNILTSDSVRTLHLLIRQLVGFSQKKVLLIIDQFEEVFTLTAVEEERQHFLDLLITAATESEGSLLVILTLRADFYERPMQYPAFYRLLDAHRVSVLSLDREGLRQVIEQPANLPDVELTFEGDLVGDLLFDIREQVGALPLLEFTLDQLFRYRNGHQLTLQAYRRIGGVKGALSRQAEETYATLPSDNHQKMARVLFMRLIASGTTQQDLIRRRTPLTDLAFPDPVHTSTIRKTANVFIGARLLVASNNLGVPTLEISHEALIREWPRLADWLITSRSDLLLQKAIGEDMAGWLQRGQPRDRLYHDSQLVEAQIWAERNLPNVDEVAFLQASMAERERLISVEQARQAKELELQYRAARRQRYVIALMGIISVVIVVALVVTLVLQGNLLTVQMHLAQTQDTLLKTLPVSVTNLNDHGSGSLREAIANAHSGDAITFAKNLKGTITLTSGNLNITKDLAIGGPSTHSISINGNNVKSVFSVSNGILATIFNLTIKNSSGLGIDNEGSLVLANSTISSCAGDGFYAGGIYNFGTLTITNSTISYNKGSGIDNRNDLTVTNSTISYNKGGGIDNVGRLSITNSTISYNTNTYTFENGIDTYGGSGIFNEGGTVKIVYCTIYNNHAQTGGGIANVNDTQPSHFIGSVLMTASIVAGNSANIGPDILGKVTLVLPSLIQNSSGTQIAVSDGTSQALTKQHTIIGKSPNLGPLQNNGGLTQTHALLPSSPAINQIPHDWCGTMLIFTDQRGMERLTDKKPSCDLGAYESGS
jgi:TIR domain/AAA ATPase domain